MPRSPAGWQWNTSRLIQPLVFPSLPKKEGYREKTSALPFCACQTAVSCASNVAKFTTINLLQIENANEVT